MQAIFLNLFYFTEKGIFPYGVDKIKVLIVQSREFGKESIGKDSTHFDKELIHFDCHILLFQGNGTSGKHRLK